MVGMLIGPMCDLLQNILSWWSFATSFQLRYLGQHANCYFLVSDSERNTERHSKPDSTPSPYGLDLMKMLLF